jgi:hypothetical protein
MSKNYWTGTLRGTSSYNLNYKGLVAEVTTINRSDFVAHIFGGESRHFNTRPQAMAWVEVTVR